MKHGEDELTDPIEGTIVPEIENSPLIPPAHDIDANDRWWIENIYRGDKMRQISCRAIFSGMMIGGVMSVSNLYVGLKTGWSLGVTVTACIIAYAVFKSLEAVIPAYRRDPFTILENCTMTSAASAAGYISSATLVSSIPALYLMTGRSLASWQMMVWAASVSILGVFMAIPLKRQLINIDKLPFPSGTATAETLKSLHSSGGKAIQQAKALFLCAAFGSLLKIWVDAWSPIMKWLGGNKAMTGWGDKLAWYSFPENFPLFPGEKGRRLLDHYTISFEGSVFLIAAGAIMGIRIGVSLLLGAIFFFGILAPTLETYNVITIMPDKAFRSISGYWTVWPSVALMVASALTSFALRWRTVARAFGGLLSIFGKESKKANPSATIEIPTWWFIAGVSVSGLSCVVFGKLFFDISPWMSVLAVLLTFVLAIVAARATGETDITPIGAMGKITQLTYAFIAPTNISTNLMTASITAGAASQSADLLTDLKAGYLLGTNPRRQTIAQFFGVLAGVLVCVPIYSIIVKTPDFDPNAPVEQVAAETSKAGAASTSTGIADAASTVKNDVAKNDTVKNESNSDVAKTNLLSKEFPAPAVAIWKAWPNYFSREFTICRNTRCSA